MDALGTYYDFNEINQVLYNGQTVSAIFLKNSAPQITQIYDGTIPLSTYTSSVVIANRHWMSSAGADTEFVTDDLTMTLDLSGDTPTGTIGVSATSNVFGQSGGFARVHFYNFINNVGTVGSETYHTIEVDFDWAYNSAYIDSAWFMGANLDHAVLQLIVKSDGNILLSTLDQDGDGIPGEPSDGAFSGFSVSFDTLLIRD